MIGYKVDIHPRWGRVKRKGENVWQIRPGWRRFFAPRSSTSRMLLHARASVLESVTLWLMLESFFEWTLGAYTLLHLRKRTRYGIGDSTVSREPAKHVQRHGVHTQHDIRSRLLLMNDFMYTFVLYTRPNSSTSHYDRAICRLAPKQEKLVRAGIAFDESMQGLLGIPRRASCQRTATAVRCRHFFRYANPPGCRCGPDDDRVVPRGGKFAAPIALLPGNVGKILSSAPRGGRTNPIRTRGSSLVGRSDVPDRQQTSSLLQHFRLDRAGC
jgi:hypothetical protein